MLAALGRGAGSEGGNREGEGIGLALACPSVSSQVVRQADFLNRVTTTTYNGRVWAATVTDPLGNVTIFSYTATGKLAASSDPDGLAGNDTAVQALLSRRTSYASTPGID